MLHILMQITIQSKTVASFPKRLKRPTSRCLIGRIVNSLHLLFIFSLASRLLYRFQVRTGLDFFSNQSLETNISAGI